MPAVHAAPPVASTDGSAQKLIPVVCAIAGGFATCVCQSKESSRNHGGLCAPSLLNGDLWASTARGGSRAPTHLLSLSQARPPRAAMKGVHQECVSMGILCTLACLGVVRSRKRSGRSVALLLLALYGATFAPAGAAFQVSTPPFQPPATPLSTAAITPSKPPPSRHLDAANDLTPLPRVGVLDLLLRHSTPSGPMPNAVDRALTSSSHRRLTEATVQCAGLSAIACGTNLANALSGSVDELVLEDGTYSGSSTFTIARDVVLRAQNAGQAVLDGQDARRVMIITSGTVTLDGLNITRGSSSGVSALSENFLPTAP